MNYSIKGIALLLVISVLFSCAQKQEQSTAPKVKTEEMCTYSFDEVNTKVFWAAYKTTDKLKVIGQFKELHTNRSGHKFSSLKELVKGIQFSINSASSSSGDETRDMSLKESFFKLFTDNFEIQGTLGEMKEGVVPANIDVFGTEQNLKLSYVVNEDVLKLKGSMSLKAIGAVKAYESIHKKCIDLHKGADGISKTWDVVDVLIEVPIRKDCK